MLQKNTSGGVSKGLALTAMAALLTLSPLGLDRLKKDEGLRTTPYRDQAGVLTVCYGDTQVNPNIRYSYKLCDEQLRSRVPAYEAVVRSLVTVPITQGQYDVLVNQVYQYGPRAFQGSTLLKKLNAGDCFGAAEEFSRWNKVRVNGKLTVNRGVQARAERRARDFRLECRVWDAQASLSTGGA